MPTETTTYDITEHWDIETTENGVQHAIHGPWINVWFMHGADRTSDIARYYQLSFDPGNGYKWDYPIKSIGITNPRYLLENRVDFVTVRCESCKANVGIRSESGSNLNWGSRAACIRQIKSHRKTCGKDNDRPETNQPAPIDPASRIKKPAYYDYIASPEWKSRADDIKRRIGKCQIGQPKKDMPECSGPLHVHHNTYEHLGREYDTDLVVLCEYHHGLIHGINESRSGGVFIEHKDGEIRHLTFGDDDDTMVGYSIVLTKNR